MLHQNRNLRKWFLDFLFLLLTFHWSYCKAVKADQASRLLHRAQKISESLRKGNLRNWQLRNLQNCNYKQQMYANSIEFAENARKFVISAGFLKECTSIYASGSTSSGIYPIWLKERFQFTYVYCDMELVSTKKGWTTIQRRINGEVNFNRGWDDYVRGFGNPRGEFWLGLENIYRFSRQTTTVSEGFTSIITPDLGIDLEDWDGFSTFLQYEIYFFGSKKSNYYSTVFSLNGRGCFDGSPIYFGEFSTPDADNDDVDQSYCGEDMKSGWWIHRCLQSNLNAPYPKQTHPMKSNEIFYEGMFCQKNKDTALRYVSMTFYHTKA
ncbi:angiopoietin-4-like [Clavelina lepadiformis]|uniref:angiopoietin-4-like n=1 Tax=Clavelina lepadiformis TaxID=159417 RepID=UPI0040436D98